MAIILTTARCRNGPAQFQLTKSGACWGLILIVAKLLPLPLLHSRSLWSSYWLHIKGMVGLLFSCWGRTIYNKTANCSCRINTNSFVETPIHLPFPPWPQPSLLATTTGTLSSGEHCRALPTLDVSPFNSGAKAPVYFSGIPPVLQIFTSW
jgi:hypothetical protein